MQELEEQIEIESQPTVLVPPAPGIYQMDDKTYHALGAMSYSRVKRLAKSPSALKYYIEQPYERTDAMRIGSALHSYLLEPDTFEHKIAVSQKFDGRTGKAAKAEFELNNLGKTIINTDEFAVLESIRQKINGHESAHALIEAPGFIEQSIFWVDPKTGVECKARIDKYFLHHDDTFTVMDLKSTTDASPEGFPREMAKYRYDIQAAMYLDGLALVTGKQYSNFVFLSVEKGESFELAVYTLDEIAIESGRQEYQRLLEEYKVCLETNTWPSYCNNQVENISLPQWAIRIK